MHLNIALGIIVALALPLQGCGKKGPLTLLPSQPQATGSQTPDSQTPVPQAPDTSAPGQNKQP